MADLVAVHRIYVTTTPDGLIESTEVVRDIEQWCFPCRTHYPHEEVGSEGGSAQGTVGEPA